MSELIVSKVADSVRHFAFAVPDELVEAIAERVAAILAQPAPTRNGSPYVNVAEAAEYLRCSRQRIYDLLSARRLTRFKDGRRVLLSRAELDEHLVEECRSPIAPELPQTSAGRLTTRPAT